MAKIAYYSCTAQSTQGSALPYWCRDTGDGKVSENASSKGGVVGDDSPPDGRPGSIKVMKMEALHLRASAQLTGCPTTSISKTAYISIVTTARTMSNVSGGKGQLTRNDIPSEFITFISEGCERTTTMVVAGKRVSPSGVPPRVES